MGWDQVEENSGSGAGFLKIKPGGANTVHILDEEPHTFQSVFFNALKKSAVIDPDNNPLAGMKGFDAKTRHAINVYCYEEQKVLVLAGSNALFNNIKAVMQEWGDLSKIDLKIKRTGDGLDTKYSVVPTPKCQWNARLIEGQELFDLPAVFAPMEEDKVMAMVQGKDPAMEFPPQDDVAPVEEAPLEPELGGTGETLEEQIVDDAPVGDLPVEEEPAPPVRRAPPPARPAPVTNNRAELVKKVMALANTRAKYKKPGAWLAEIKRFGGKDKTSLSQLGVDALQKLQAFIRTVK